MPRTEEQFEGIREQKISLIMQSSLELFANEGYYPTSISRIAEKAGISKGLMYNYFKSKEDLILAILGKGIQDLTKNLDPDRDGYLTEEEFTLFINENFQILQDNFEYWKLYFATMMQPTVSKLVKERYPHFLPPMYKIFEAYFERKGVADPAMETEFFDAVLDGIFINYVMNPDTFPLEKMREFVITRFK